MYVKSEREMTMYIHIYVEIEVVKEKRCRIATQRDGR